MAQSTPLHEILIQQIKTLGPISVADYMAMALGHPRHGYYATRDPFGRGGDFVTAPEISQMFGELIGLWLAQIWLDRGRPSAVTLVELGPGRGTLMRDLLRAAKAVPGFQETMSVHLVETSPTLTGIQKETLSGHTISWHTQMQDALATGTGPIFVIGNEFFDALPIRQYLRVQNRWHERLIGVGDDEELCFTPSALTVSLLGAPSAEDGAIWEECPMATGLMEEIAGAIAARGGAGLIIDYGHGKSAPGDTLQAVKAHEFHNVLEAPGEADLTAHVDFDALGRAARKGGASSYPLLTQGAFLKALGIEPRAAQLSAAAPQTQSQDIRAALTRLTQDAEMGTLFKVLAISDKTAPTPPCFEGSVQTSPQNETKQRP